MVDQRPPPGDPKRYAADTQFKPHHEGGAMMPLFLTAFIMLGGLFICMSLPLIHRRVAPNAWYGFRVRSTLEDPDIWYPANAYAAWRLLWVGVATTLVAIAVYCIPNVELPVYASIVAATAVIGLAITFVQSLVYIGQLKREIPTKHTDTESTA